MKRTIRSAVFSICAIGLLYAVSAAQSSDQASSPSATTQGSASSTKHHAKGTSENAAGAQLNAIDKHFIRKAGQGGLAEVELGKLAADKGQSDEVKKFGQRMVDDHTKANDQLKQLAESKGVTLPTTLDAKDKATKARLSKLSGENFDVAYMKDMVKDHTTDVAEFKKESTAAKDPDVKSFASQTLPTLQDHLKNARALAPKQGTKSGK